MFHNYLKRLKDRFGQPRTTNSAAEPEHQEINPKPDLQFNGLVLLNGYLQRLFVHKQIRLQLKKDDQQDASLPPLLDRLNAIIGAFDKTKPMPSEQADQALDILHTVEQKMTDYLPAAPATAGFADKLAVAGSTIYAEEHINNGIIKMGEWFNPAVQDRFMQQVPYHRNRVALVNQAVHKTASSAPLSEHEQQTIEQWYEDVRRNEEGFQKDFTEIRAYITGSK